MVLQGLYRYPLKSGAAEALTEADVRRRGIAHDRRWMLVDTDGQFLTGRQHPRMVLLQCSANDQGLLCRAPDQVDLQVPRPGPDAARRKVAVWDDTVSAAAAGATADRWFSQFLQQDCQLVYMDTRSQRVVDPAFGQAGDTVSFADGYPLLLIGSASIEELQRRSGVALDALRFRPNLILQTTVPHVEDQWRRIRIGAVEFDLVKACGRCRFTTVDPFTGVRHPAGEPLKTLTRYRRQDGEILFGQNLIPRQLGVLRIGTPVQVLTP